MNDISTLGDSPTSPNQPEPDQPKQTWVKAVAIGGLVFSLIGVAVLVWLVVGNNDSDDASKDDTPSETTVAADGASETTAAVDEQAGGSDAASETTEKADPTKKPAPKRDPSVEGFCDALVGISDQQAGEQDFGQLLATAPDEIAPMVDTLAETAEEASATEQPSEELQERGIRSVVGVTIYAIDECDGADGLIESIGLGPAELDVLSKYSVEDIDDDAKWKELLAELQGGEG